MVRRHYFLLMLVLFAAPAFWAAAQPPADDEQRDPAERDHREPELDRYAHVLDRVFGEKADADQEQQHADARQRVHAHDDGVSVSAQQVHEPAVFRRLRNVRPAGVAAFEGSYAVDRLDKVGIRPGTLAARCRKTQPAVRRVGGMIERGGLGVVKEDLEIAHAFRW